MRISRVFYEGELHEESTIVLPSDTSHYIIHVLRLRVGSNLILFNGQGGEYTGEIADIQKKCATIFIEKYIDCNVESPFMLHLAQGISRQEKMDLVIQKAVELGVSKITPLLTEYSNIKLDKERMEKRLLHWQKIIVSACEQSGRNTLPKLDGIVGLNEWITHCQAELKLICKPGANSYTANLPRPKEVILLIGPEGGLSSKEINAAHEHHFLEISLGPRILRTETAAIAATAILQSHWGDM